MALGHWHWHWHWLASMLLAPHEQVGKWRAPLPLASAPSAYWSGVRQSSTHAPLLLLHPLCCTRRRTLTLTLSYSHTRSAAQVCLSSSAVAPSLHSLSSSSQPSLHVLDNPHPSHARPPSLVPRVRMNLPHSWSVSSSLPYPPRLNLLVPRGASSPRPRVDFSNLSS